MIKKFKKYRICVICGYSFNNLKKVFYECPGCGYYQTTKKVSYEKYKEIKKGKKYKNRYFTCMICNNRYDKEKEGKICCACGNMVKRNNVKSILICEKESLLMIINGIYDKNEIEKNKKYLIHEAYKIAKNIYSIRTFFKI